MLPSTNMTRQAVNNSHFTSHGVKFPNQSEIISNLIWKVLRMDKTVDLAFEIKNYLSVRTKIEL